MKKRTTAPRSRARARPAKSQCVPPPWRIAWSLWTSEGGSSAGLHGFGHGVIFYRGAASREDVVAFLPGYSWLHEPLLRDVLVNVYRRSSGTEGSRDKSRKTPVPNDIRRAVTQFLDKAGASGRLPFGHGQNIGGFRVWYNA